uniref:DUF1080 domain-containing protein n=1 Tax=Schlesneria paludicola TaxID=360056 RepID=A0A7C2PA92_9PLAN
MSQPPPTLDSRIQAAVQEYLERIDRGEVVDRERFLARFPDVADAVRSFIASSEELARWAQRGSASAISTNSVAEAASQAVPREKLQASTGGGGSKFDALPADFGRYRVLKLLGKGAMGSVFLAEDTQLQRQIALKIPSFDQDHTGELLERFYREARSAATLRQPNICPVYDVGEIDGQHYITMAYIAGRALSELIKSDKPPGERATLLIVRKLALALQEAHNQGIIHRDLKPGNVMIDARGEPIVMDFGLACRMEQEDAARLTHSGVIVGSPAYMSPEQVEGNPDKLTPAADQYSLGVILYEMLTGQLPFKGNIAAVIAQITTKSPQPPRELKPEIDPRVEAVCLRMLSKSAADRFPSLKAVADELAAIVRDPKAGPPAAETSSNRAAVSATTSLADRQREIQSLLKAGDLTAAREALEGLAALQDARHTKVRDWAKQQLAKLQADAQRWETEVPQLLELARKLVRKHDYGDAAKLLGQVPAFARTPALAELLEQATDKQEECDALLADIERAVRKEQSQELPMLVKRLLQLKPGHTGIKRLAADIRKHGVERAMRAHQGDRRYLDPAGRVWNPLHLARFVGGLAALCCALYFAVVSLQNREQEMADEGTPAERTAAAKPDPSSEGPQPPVTEESGFTPLFNGRDFTGWDGDQSGWIISNGVLASRRGLQRPTAVLTDREFTDYELRLEFRLLNPGNATVYLRGERDEQDRAIGHVVQLGFLRLESSRPENVTGDLFRRRSRRPQGGRPSVETARRMTRQSFLSHAEGDRRDEINRAYREREWNDLTIRCIGRREVVELNGLTTADVTDAETPLSGRIGLHLWGTMEADDPIATTPDIQFRNIRVKELTATPQ